MATTPREAVREFVEKYQEDRRAGTVRPVEEYQRCWPGFEEAVLHAFEALQADAGSARSFAPESGEFGPYRLGNELGRGGQAVVYLAEDTRLHRRVALKILRNLGPGSEDTVRRFRREAGVAAKLKHPGICAVLDAGYKRKLCSGA